MDDRIEFEIEKEKNLEKVLIDDSTKKISLEWQQYTGKYNYTYNFSWLGLPIIQFPQDIVVMQEIIWNEKPDLIIETGIARGGSLIFYSSILELIGNKGKVLGIDIDIRQHNRDAIESHPLYRNIEMIEGSSIDANIFSEVVKIANKYSKILVCLDSNHTYEHVMKELELYSSLVKAGSYVVVCDTGIEDAPDSQFGNREWKRGNSPKTAVLEFVQKNDRFEIDKTINSKTLITSNWDGYLKCIKD